MDSFLKIHSDTVVGTLSTFDRLLFKGHLTTWFPAGAFARFLYHEGVLLKDFKDYVSRVSAELKAHAEQMAEEAGRAFIYLTSATTKAQGCSKEDHARRIIEEEGIEEGLVCVFSVLEPCSSFTVQGNRETHRLQVVRRARKCSGQGTNTAFPVLEQHTVPSPVFPVRKKSEPLTVKRMERVRDLETSRLTGGTVRSRRRNPTQWRRASSPPLSGS